MEWYVLQVRPGHEQAVAAAWRTQGMAAFVPGPLYRTRVCGQWQIRRAVTRYVFVSCEMTEALYAQWRNMRHVVGFLGMPGARYTAVPDEDVLRLGGDGFGGMAGRRGSRQKRRMGGMQ